MAAIRKYAVFSIVVLLMIAAVRANAGRAGRLDDLLILDSDGMTVLAWSVFGSLFRTADAGKHWTRLTGLSGKKVSIVTLEQNRRSVVFAESFAESGGLVYASTDQGTTWNDLVPSNGDLQKPLPHVDLHDPAFLYATLTDKVVYSTNGGDTWEILKPSIAREVIHGIWLDPRDMQSVYAGALLRGIYHSTDGGATWSSMPGLPRFPNTYRLSFDPTDPGTMYLETGPVYIESSEGDLYKSVDGGQNWTAIHLVIDFFTIIPGDPSVLLARAWTLRSNRNYFFLQKSTNRGGEWTNADYAFAKNDRIVALVSSLDHSNLYAIADGRVFKSIDLGRSWTSTRLP
jgi:photosystem II stability/assembly factor-like uncharacterized protein